MVLAVAMFLAHVHAAGGVSQHPGPSTNNLVNPFYLLIQAHPEWFAETNNRVAFYYSLGQFMGHVGRIGGPGASPPITRCCPIAGGLSNPANPVDSQYLKTFQEAFPSAQGVDYEADVVTDFSDWVHVHNFQHDKKEIEVYHLVNFDYDPATEEVTSAPSGVSFQFTPNLGYSNPVVTYYWPEIPDDQTTTEAWPEVVLIVTPLGSETHAVTVPQLHIYGVLVVEEGP